MGCIRPHGAGPGRLPSLGEHFQHGSSQELQCTALGHLPRLHQTSQQCYDRHNRPGSPDYYSGVRLCAQLDRQRQRLWKHVAGLHQFHQVRSR